MAGIVSFLHDAWRRRVGKTTPEDELNCGGCGYDDCRSLAMALLDGRAEAGMCVSHLRKLAMTKANALIQAMPSGVVIADESRRDVAASGEARRD